MIEEYILNQAKERLKECLDKIESEGYNLYIDGCDVYVYKDKDKEVII